ncbi:MAG: class I SAM-dependent methyltransferase [Acidimicrobiales bacterium]|nr:class I SAM-dependent methyltransferase [Acidimicrobiales bacterium]
MTAGPIPEWVERYQTTTPPLPGWFYNVDLRLFALLNQLQVAGDVSGDLLEVGGHLARSAVALGYMRRDHESLVVIDPWDAYVHLEATLEENDREHDRFDTGATLEQFKENYLRFHAQLPDIRQGISTEQLKHLPAGRFRFIHIDGSHEWRVVSADVGQVLRILSPGGVVAFDDMFDRRFAGVGAAVWPACSRGDLVPLATTDKLYATRGPSRVSAASVARAVEDDPELRILSRHPIFGSEVLEVTMSPPPLLGRLHRYVPPALVDVARERNIGTRARRALARLPGRGSPRTGAGPAGR